MKILKLGQMLGGSNSPSGAGFENKYSLTFDGVDDYVTFGDEDVFTPNNSGANRGMSWSFWMKTPNVASQALINKSAVFYGGANHYEYYILTRFDGKPRVILYGGDSASIYLILTLDTILSADTWQHIAFTWDLGSTNADIIGYIDGVKHSVADGNATFLSAGTWAAVVNTNNDLQLARVATQYGETFLDEIAIFDDELSTVEIQAIYNSGTPTDLSGESYLLGYWRNGDTAGTSVYPTIEDYSSEGNDGTMTNMASGDIQTDVP